MAANKNHAKNILLFSAFAGLLMSADKKGCEQAQQVTGPRQLKKIVQMDEVRIAPLLLDNKEFDFAFQVNDEIKIALASSDFYVRKVMPGQSLSRASGDDGFFNVQKLSDGREVYKLSASMLGLDSVSTKQLEAWDPNLLKTTISVDSNVACLISRPQYDLSLSVNSLEVKDGAHINFGFNAISSFPLSAVKFGIDRSEMKFSIHAWSGVTGAHLSSLSHPELKKDYNGGIKIDLGAISIGPEFYKKTGLQEVTSKGLKNTLGLMANKLKSEEWSSRVLVNKDNTIIFTGGKELNIKAGDRFQVYESIVLTENNMSACKDDGVVYGEVAGEYKWVVEVIDAGDGISSAKVLNPHPDMNIETGFKVVLDKRVEDIQAEAAKQNAKK